MNPTVLPGRELIVLLVILVAGFLTGLLFDLVRAAAKALPIHRSIIFLVDFLLCLVAALAVYQFLYTFNQGEARFYAHLAFFLGIALYYLYCGRYLYKSMFHNLKYIVRIWAMAKTAIARKGKLCCRIFDKTGNGGG